MTQQHKVENQGLLGKDFNKSPQGKIGKYIGKRLWGVMGRVCGGVCSNLLTSSSHGLHLESSMISNLKIESVPPSTLRCKRCACNSERIETN